MGGPGGSIYVDLDTTDYTFASGQYSGAGPLPASTSSYHSPTLKANTLYYYRINEKGTDGS